jgi:hypothetical protein
MDTRIGCGIRLALGTAAGVHASSTGIVPHRGGQPGARKPALRPGLYTDERL